MCGCLPISMWNSQPFDNQRMKPMKILVASTPAIGHVNPMLAIARVLMTEDHEVAIYTGSAFRARVEASGAEFFSLPPDADFDPTDPFARFPELKALPPGFEWMRVVMERIFVDNIPAQHEGLQRLLHRFGPDVIVGDDMFFGVLPMLLGARSKRPPVVLCGTSILHWPREDGARSGSACRRRQRLNSVMSTHSSRGTMTRPSIGLWDFASTGCSRNWASVRHQ